MATRGTRAAAKRKRQRSADAIEDALYGSDGANDSDDDVCVVEYAPGTAPPPRAKRAWRQPRETTAVGPVGSHIATAPAAQAPPKPDGMVLEVGYMGTTRAVVGHGFQVCELLFADEFASLHITNWMGGDPQTLCEMIESYAQRIGLLGENVRVVHYVDSAKEGTVTLHLMSKQVARSLFTSLCSSDVMAIEPIQSTGLVKDAALARAEYSQRLNITWADGVATGGANLFFADVGEANAFLTSYYRKESELSSCVITVIGVPALDDINMEELEEDVVLERVLQLSEYDRQAWVPPLRCVRVDADRNNDQMYFDEAKIGGMRAKRVSELEFNVQIVSGLPLDVDEVRLEELVAPHKIVHCKIVRVDDTGRRPSERLGRQRRAMPLTWHIDATEPTVDWEDTTAKRVGVCVHFPSAERMKVVYDAAMASPFWNGMVSPLGQPVRLGIEYIYCAHLDKEVYQYYRFELIQVRQGLVNKSVWCTVDRDTEDKTVITVKFGSTSRAGLSRMVKLLEDIIQCERIDDASIRSVLFSRAGRAKVRDWLAKREGYAGLYAPAFIRLLDEDKTIWVYGQEASRMEGLTALRTLALSIQKDVQVVDRIARIDPGLLEGSASIPANIDDDDRPALMVQPVLRNLYEYTVVDRVNNLSVAGTSQQAEDRLKAWESAGCFLSSEELSTQQPRPECGVCMMQVDEPVVKFTLCGHTFCHECIQPGLSDSNRLPLVCPMGGCGGSIHVKDVAKATKDVRALLETAVFDYVGKHPSECAVCPKSGCNQILSRAFIEGGDSSGEQYTYCDKCTKSYCLTCSEATSNAMERHDGTSCEDFQAVGGSAGDHFVKYIRDKIFTLCCPKCKAAFLDFDGCTSVACGNVTCREYFCANCLDYSSKSSATTHTHVLQCPKNPLPGRYHVPAESLVTAHRTRRTDQLRDYLVANVPLGEPRRIVLKRLTKDLADLGITCANELLTVTTPAPPAPVAPAPPPVPHGPFARLPDHLRQMIPQGNVFGGLFGPVWLREGLLERLQLPAQVQERLEQVQARLNARLNQLHAQPFGPPFDQEPLAQANFNARLNQLHAQPLGPPLPAFNQDPFPQFQIRLPAPQRRQPRPRRRRRRRGAGDVQPPEPPVLPPVVIPARRARGRRAGVAPPAPPPAAAPQYHIIQFGGDEPMPLAPPAAPPAARPRRPRARFADAFADPVPPPAPAIQHAAQIQAPPPAPAPAARRGRGRGPRMMLADLLADPQFPPVLAAPGPERQRGADVPIAPPPPPARPRGHRVMFADPGDLMAPLPPAPARQAARRGAQPMIIDLT